jgi:hypothetical protein
MDGHKILGHVRPAWVVVAVVAAAGLVALGVPLVALLFIGVLLLCPLMMLGMHGGEHRQATHDETWSGSGAPHAGAETRDQVSPLARHSSAGGGPR